MAELNGLRIADRKHIGLAEMLKGGVIMDVTNAEQAKIAEDAGAASVMALERVPSDIRKDGGVARMSPVKKIQEIQKAVTIPVMAKARIGHFVEAQILEALEVDLPLVVHTDSQYAIGVLTKNWKPKANQELIQRIKQRMQTVRRLELVYVPGHAGVPLNERADELARAAVAARASSGWQRRKGLDGGGG